MKIAVINFSGNVGKSPSPAICCCPASRVLNSSPSKA